MDLSCGEYMGNHSVEPTSPRCPPEPQTIFAPMDPMMSTDPRIIPNLLMLEKSSIPRCDYFVHVQDDIQPFMRKVVTTWMLEVCEEQSCEEQVFPLAVNYMDRVLCARAIPRHQLQLLASATLLLASKIRQGVALPVPLLCTYTDNSITPDELRHWEMLVLHLLQWQTFSVTSFDFIEQILARTCWSCARPLIRMHAHTLAALCYTDTDFMLVPPSLTATACLLAAARGLGAGIISTTIASLATSTGITFSSASIAGTSQGLDLTTSSRAASPAVSSTDMEVSSDPPSELPPVLPASVDGLAALCSLSGSCPILAERAVRHVEQLVARETAPPKNPHHASPTNPPGTPTDVQNVLF